MSNNENATHGGDTLRYANEECSVCGGGIDVTLPGYYKSTNDMVFRHSICHEQGEPPEGYVFEMVDTELCCTNRQYNCGHIVFAPQKIHPSVCPECNDLSLSDGTWESEQDG